MPRRALVLALFALALAGCGSSGSTSGGDDPASAVPRDAAMYVDATVRPEGSQRDDALDAAGKVLATSDPQAKIDELIKKALAESDGLQLDYARDVEPWLGEKAGFWLSAGGDQNETRGAAVLSSTDSDAAQAAIERAVKGSDKRFSKRTYKDVDYQVNEEGGAAAVAEDFVLLGTEAEVKRTIDTLDGGKPLADDDRYKEAIDGLDEARLGTMYLDVRRLYETAKRSDPQAAQQLQQFERLFPIDQLGPVSAAFFADGDRLAVDTISAGGAEIAKRWGAFSGSGSTPLLGELPGDSWAALGSPKLGETAKAIYDGLAGALGGAAIQQQLQQRYGIDLQQDVFSWIGDAAFFARGTSMGSIDGGAVIEVTDQARAKAAFPKLTGLAQTSGGAKARPISVPGAETAFAFSQPGAPKPIVAALGDGRLAITYGEAAAADALQPKDKLADSEAFGAAKSLLGDGLEPGFLLSMPQVVSLSASESGDDPDVAKAKPYLDAFTVLAGGGKVDGDTSRSKFVAGLK
jgi:hypothetical protein